MQTNFIEIENSKYLINQAIDALNSNYLDIENLISSDLISVNKDTYHFIADLLLKTNQKDSLIKVFHKLLMNTTYRTETLTQDGGVSNFIFSMIFLKKLLKLDKNQGQEASRHFKITVIDKVHNPGESTRGARSSSTVVSQSQHLQRVLGTAAMHSHKASSALHDACCSPTRESL